MLKKLARFFRAKSTTRGESDAMRAPLEAFEPWWQSYHVPLNKTRIWHVGNIELGMKHLPFEWQLASWMSASPHPDNNPHNLPGLVPEFPEKRILHKRFAAHSLNAEIRLHPVLADKPLASRLQEALYIPANSEAVLYVCSPLWIRVESLSPVNLIDEIATYPMSETWYGPNTLEGELCYAGFTDSSTRLDELPRYRDRILTPVRIRNLSRSVMTLDKAIIPLPYLSIFVDQYHQLWTEQLIVRREGDDYPEVKLTKGPPALVPDARLLTPPRVELSPGTGLRSLFSALIRK